MDGTIKRGWNPATVILVFCFLQGLIFLIEWYWFFSQLAREEIGLLR